VTFASGRGVSNKLEKCSTNESLGLGCGAATAQMLCPSRPRPPRHPAARGAPL